MKKILLSVMALTAVHCTLSAQTIRVLGATQRKSPSSFENNNNHGRKPPKAVK